MSQNLRVIVITGLLGIGCGGLPDTAKKEDMMAKPLDMTSSIAIDPSCKNLYSSILLNCKPTNDAKGTECEAPLREYQNCSTLCGAEVACQTEADSLKISGYYQEPGNANRQYIIKSAPFVQIKGVSDSDVLYSALMNGNSKTNYFSLYYTKRSNEAEKDLFKFEIVALTAQGSGDCPASGLSNVKARVITLRNVPAKIPTNIFDTSIQGQAETIIWMKNWSRNTAQTDADPPVCP